MAERQPLGSYRPHVLLVSFPTSICQDMACCRILDWMNLQANPFYVRSMFVQRESSQIAGSLMQLVLSTQRHVVCPPVYSSDNPACEASPRPMLEIEGMICFQQYPTFTQKNEWSLFAHVVEECIKLRWEQFCQPKDGTALPCLAKEFLCSLYCTNQSLVIQTCSPTYFQFGFCLLSMQYVKTVLL